MTRRRIFFRLLFAAYLIALAFVCLSKATTTMNLPGTWFGLPKDKVVHFLMFLPYPIIVYFAFFRQTGRRWWMVTCLVITVIMGLVIGGGIELIQGTTTYRSADIADFRADALGTLSGAVITLIYAAVSGKW